MPTFAMPPQLRSPTPAGAPLILAPRLPVNATTMAQVSTAQAMQGASLNGAPPPLVSPTDGSVLYPYDPYSLAQAQAAQSQLLEYHTGLEQSTVGTSFVR